MSIVKREPNFSRKSHRVDIPLLVQVEGKVYPAADWSMTGVGIRDLDHAGEIGTTLPATLILPLADTSLHIRVTLVIRNRRQGVTGCEFKGISSRNRRILRHFIELSLEGRADSVEDLVADLAAPDIESPLETALALSEEEHISLLAKFKNRASIALLLGVAFAAFLLFSLWYNHVFLYKTIGVVQGNFLDVSVSQPGVLERILVRPGTIVHAGDILFELSSVSIDRELLRKRDRLDQIKNLLIETTKKQTATHLLSALREEWQRQEKQYRNAKKLHMDGVISNKDFEFISSAWNRARINFLRQQRAEERYNEEKESKREGLLQEKELLNREIHELELEKEDLRIRSPDTGTVYAVGRQRGEFVNPGEVVLVLARNTRPVVLFKMPSSQASRIAIGSQVHVYSYHTDATVVGRVSAIGYKAISPGVPASQEVSLDMTVIRVDLPAQSQRMAANSRVKVWVRKQLTPWLGFGRLFGRTDGKSNK